MFMAKANGSVPVAGYDPNPNRITVEEYQQIMKEKEELTQKQLDANCEFMWQHYNRMLRALDQTIERGAHINQLAERRVRKEQAKAKRAAVMPKESA
jgi:hypothetical protein